MEERLHHFESQVESQVRERAVLLTQLETRASSDSPVPDHDKLVKVNNKLKRVVQTFKEKIQRLAAERPELFSDVGEDTNERFDHLISTVHEQASYIAVLQAERDQVEEQMRRQMHEFRR